MGLSRASHAWFPVLVSANESVSPIALLTQRPMPDTTNTVTPVLPKKGRTRYNWHQTYDWNYEHGPKPPLQDEAAVPGQWDFCGLPVGSPLGVAAGPLLNGKWILYYAALGFDVLTYKTVRSRARLCY